MSNTAPGGFVDGNPFAEQQRTCELLSQETRHLIFQWILGHLAHLASLATLPEAVTEALEFDEPDMDAAEAP